MGVADLVDGPYHAWSDGSRTNKSQEYIGTLLKDERCSGISHFVENHGKSEADSSFGVIASRARRQQWIQCNAKDKDDPKLRATLKPMLEQHVAECFPDEDVSVEVLVQAAPRPRFFQKVPNVSSFYSFKRVGEELRCYRSSAEENQRDVDGVCLPWKPKPLAPGAAAEEAEDQGAEDADDQRAEDADDQRAYWLAALGRKQREWLKA